MPRSTAAAGPHPRPARNPGAAPDAGNLGSGASPGRRPGQPATGLSAARPPGLRAATVPAPAPPPRPDATTVLGPAPPPRPDAGTGPGSASPPNRGTARRAGWGPGGCGRPDRDRT